MHENVFEKFPGTGISASIVWMPILDKDNFDAAIPSVNFLRDRRIQHFYDNGKATGKAIADSVGWRGNIAWDIYLFYKPDTKWTDKPPSPSYWMHQLSDKWANREQHRTGKDLKNELLISMTKLLKREKDKN